MLKELWRKLGTEFLQTNYTEDECIETAPGFYDPPEFRILPHITHTGEFHLERLTAILDSRYGRSYAAMGASSEDGVRALILFAARIQDQDVQRELLLLYLNCSPLMQEYLRSSEILGTSRFLSPPLNQR
ncbi:MAG: hypothetical protein ACTHYN_07630 [Marinobacter sp.]|uniref:hypothetical protein n=1 Tax=Marinobacter sp. TaxID=50741 RepID=UPI003F972AA3